MRNKRFLFLLFLQTRIPMARTHIFFSAYKKQFIKPTKERIIKMKNTSLLSL